MSIGFGHPYFETVLTDSQVQKVNSEGNSIILFWERIPWSNQTSHSVSGDPLLLNTRPAGWKTCDSFRDWAGPLFPRHSFTPGICQCSLSNSSIGAWQWFITCTGMFHMDFPVAWLYCNSNQYVLICHLEWWFQNPMLVTLVCLLVIYLQSRNEFTLYMWVCGWCRACAM